MDRGTGPAVPACPGLGMILGDRGCCSLHRQCLGSREELAGELLALFSASHRAEQGSEVLSAV